MSGPWIAVASADHVAAGVRAGVFACSHGRGDAVARPRNGDRFAYYAPRERMGAGGAVHAFRRGPFAVGSEDFAVIEAALAEARDG